MQNKLMENYFPQKQDSSTEVKYPDPILTKIMQIKNINVVPNTISKAIPNFLTRYLTIINLTLLILNIRSYNVFACYICRYPFIISA